jgi:hypothetical protein
LIEGALGREGSDFKGQGIEVVVGGGEVDGQIVIDVAGDGLGEGDRGMIGGGGEG